MNADELILNFLLNWKVEASIEERAFVVFGDVLLNICCCLGTFSYQHTLGHFCIAKSQFMH